MVNVERRVVDALTRIADRHDRSAVVAVSHETPIHLVIARLAGIEGAAFWSVELPTGSVTRLVQQGGTLWVASEVRMRDAT